MNSRLSIKTQKEIFLWVSGSHICARERDTNMASPLVGEGYPLWKWPGCSSENFKNIPKRHQNLVLWACPKFMSTPKRYRKWYWLVKACQASNASGSWLISLHLFFLDLIVPDKPICVVILQTGDEWEVPKTFTIVYHHHKHYHYYDTFHPHHSPAHSNSPLAYSQKHINHHHATTTIIISSYLHIPHKHLNHHHQSHETTTTTTIIIIVIVITSSTNYSHTHHNTTRGPHLIHPLYHKSPHFYHEHEIPHAM